MKRLVSLIIFILISLALLHLVDVSNYFYHWRKNSKKIPRRGGEKLRNFKALLENILEVERHNELYSEGKTTFKMRLNSFGEIPTSEFTNRRNGFRRVVTALGAAPGSNIPFRSSSDTSVPAEVDWRIQGAVTPIKDQGTCGSCWAFSAAATLEGQLFIRSGQLIDLSEQHLVDCASSNYGNKGCNGGFMESAYQYIQDNGGINSEDSYPYEARDGDCRATNTNAGTLRDFVSIQSGNETQLMEAVATVGPVAVAIDASRRSFQFYSEGVYYEPECSSTILDHAVLVIGYGSTSDGLDYWIIKNSYGDDWGENGYFRLARNRNNHCGIATSASYPLV